jgi:hypothetical protein
MSRPVGIESGLTQGLRVTAEVLPEGAQPDLPELSHLYEGRTPPQIGSTFADDSKDLFFRHRHGGSLSP